MMNRRMISVLLFALLVSGGASAGLYRMITSRMPSSKPTQSNKLFVAAHNLDPGALLKETDIVETDWPGVVPPGVLNAKADIVGRGVVAAIYEKEPIVETRIGARGAGAGFAANIPDGMRAVAVRVNEVVGVAGFVVPGTHVDILVTGNAPNSGDGTMVKTILQDIEVLSAGQNFQRDAEGKPVSVQVVNLLVTPDQAEVLSLASNETKIQLVLRNPIDRKVAATKGAAMGQLFSDGKPRPVRTRTIVAASAAPVPRVEIPPVVEMINGIKRVQTTFPGVKP
jgi:pilus assembly protein CpaB